ncbi:MAG TPA: serpin family protein [Candidatus Obscuribacterales bacterium]
MTSIRLLAPTEKFGYALLGQEVERNPGKNVWVSPSAVSIPLGMLLNSARTSTRSALVNSLGLGYEDASTVNAAYSNLIAALKDPSTGVKLAIANSIWANKDFNFKKAFYNANRQHFGATVKTRNFGDPKTLTDINGWVSKETEELIKELLKEIGPDAIMYLLSATFFKGTWKTTFDKDRTAEYQIRLGNGDIRHHPMMFLANGGFAGWKQGIGRIGVLPFGTTDERVSFIGILPEHGQNVHDVVGALKPGFLRDAFTSVHPADDGLYFPRFKIGYEANLNDSLKALGLEEAFHQGADFSQLMTNPKHRPFISAVQHKAMAQFDEIGAVAAAATSVEICLESCVMPLTFDRPFVGLIVDRATGALLFAGAINDPERITEETDWSEEVGTPKSDETGTSASEEVAQHEILHEICYG